MMMSYTYAQPNTVSHQVNKYSRLGQFAAQTIQFRQVNSFTEDTPKAIKHFIPMATHSFLLLYIRLTMKNLIGREHSINSQ